MSDTVIRLILGLATSIFGLIIIIVAPVGGGSEMGIVVLALGSLSILYA